MQSTIDLLNRSLGQAEKERDEAMDLLADIQDNEYVVSVTTAQRLDDLLKRRQPAEAPSAAPGGGERRSKLVIEVTDLAERELHLDAPPPFTAVPGGPAPGASPTPAGQATATFTTVLDGVPISGKIVLTSTPPPPAPALTSLSVSPASVVGGQPATGTVLLSAPAAASVAVALLDASVATTLPAAVIVPAGAQSASFAITTLAVTAMQAVPISASLSGVTRTATLNVTAPPAPVPVEISVLTYGAKGDGITDDSGAIQAAINAAAPGQTVRFPVGTWYTGQTPLSLTRAVKLVGVGGKASTLKNIGVILRLGNTGLANIPGVEIHGLHFLGQVGLYMANGNTWPAIQNLSGTGLVVDDCDFSGCGWLVANMGTSYGSTLTNLRGAGWGEAGFFCNGGETIKNCKIVQDDPSLRSTSSHGFYIHSMAHDVLIEDCWAENCRSYGFQLYGQEVPSTIQRVTFRRTTFKAGRSGGTVFSPMLGAARASDILIEDCSFLQTYEGASLYVNNGDRITVRGCLFDGGSRALQLGVWPPEQANFNVTDFNFSGNTIKNQSVFGLWQGGGYGGTFTRCTIGPNVYSNNKQDIQKDNAPGIQWL